MVMICQLSGPPQFTTKFSFGMQIMLAVVLNDEERVQQRSRSFRHDERGYGIPVADIHADSCRCPDIITMSGFTAWKCLGATAVGTSGGPELFPATMNPNFRDDRDN